MSLSSWMIIFMLIISSACSKNTPENLFHLKFSPSLTKDWKQIYLREENGFLQSTYQNEDRFLLMTRYEANTTEREKLFQSKIHQLQALFSPQFTPYGGVITQKTSCLNKLNESSIVDGISSQMISFSLIVDERLSYGQCLEEGFFKSFYQILNCKKTPYLYEVKFFYKKNSKEQAPEHFVVNCN